ncbi:MAG: sugar phosphate nucleotidyltransferase, partial [Pseudomonadota bacterium]
MMADGEEIIPVVLCGGSGTRLWPLSRKSYPKQFVDLVGGKTLLEQTVSRFLTPSYAAPIVVTGEPFRFIVTTLTSRAGAPSPTILVEPDGRNTAPATLAAAIVALQGHKD